jgi:putative Mn2+ efflux pump MntP
MAALVLAALAVGIDNFAVSIGLGLAGVDARARLRIAVVFGVFEGGMPLLGVLLGSTAAHGLGTAATDVGGAVLIAMGCWALIENRRNEPESSTSTRIGPLLVTAFALSIDNLVVGFGLGVTRRPLVEALIVFVAISTALTLLGLTLGARLGGRVGEFGGKLGALLLIVVGVLVLVGRL